MTTPGEEIFRFLALCTQRPGHAAVVERLSGALAAIPAGQDLVAISEQHGLAGLVLAHIRESKAIVPPGVTVGLFARSRWHAQAAAVRRRIAGEALDALNGARIPLLVLKGAALAQLVYADPVWRPMRDVDLLVRPQDARRAYAALRSVGFAPSPAPTAVDHHHLPGLLKSEDDTTILIELHHQLLPPAPFVAPVRYDDLRPSAQRFDWDGLEPETLGREDMLWHVYMHGFAIGSVSPQVRLSALADLVHATEAWADRLDWDALRRRRGRMVRALRRVGRVVPWSDSVERTLGVEDAGSGVEMPALDDWTFDVRYGIDARWRRLWCRAAAHPLRVALERGDAAARRTWRRLTGSRRLHETEEPRV